MTIDLMPTVEKLSIALPPEMADLLREAVKSGEYASTSEVVRGALRAWKRKRAVEMLGIVELRQLVREGIASSPALDAEAVLSRLESKIRRDAKESEKKPTALKLSIFPRAAPDLESTGDYIARDNPARAVSFIRELRQQCRRVARLPAAFPAPTSAPQGLEGHLFGLASCSNFPIHK